jgi:hypothetical protein
VAGAQVPLMASARWLLYRATPAASGSAIALATRRTLLPSLSMDQSKTIYVIKWDVAAIITAGSCRPVATIGDIYAATTNASGSGYRQRVAVDPNAWTACRWEQKIIGGKA